MSGKRLGRKKKSVQRQAQKDKVHFVFAEKDRKEKWIG